MGNAIPGALITVVYRYLPVRAKIGIAFLPCIFELSAHVLLQISNVEHRDNMPMKCLYPSKTDRYT